MTQEELNNKIEELEKQITELKQVRVEEPKRWKPEYGERYFYITDCGNILDDIFDEEGDEWRILNNNIFKTEEEAEEYKTKLEVRAKYKNFIEEHSEPIDWGNGEEVKE